MLACACVRVCKDVMPLKISLCVVVHVSYLFECVYIYQRMHDG